MKRRGVFLLASIVVMVVAGAAVALAANISCAGDGVNCLGTNSSDTITGPNSTDIITGASGGDTVNARGGDDQAYGDAGNDTLNGGGGNDYLEGGRGANTLDGQGGDKDVLNVVDGDGNDLAIGGDGDNDFCIIDVNSSSIFGSGEPDASSSCETVLGTFEP